MLFADKEQGEVVAARGKGLNSGVRPYVRLSLLVPCGTVFVHGACVCASVVFVCGKMRLRCLHDESSMSTQGDAAYCACGAGCV